MERVRGAGAVLAVLVVLGAPPAAGEELSGVFHDMFKYECHFINGTERVRTILRRIYNREQYVHFDSDVGVFVGDTPHGEKVAREWNSDQDILEYVRSLADGCCRHNYKCYGPFSVERRAGPTELTPLSQSQRVSLMTLQLPGRPKTKSSLPRTQPPRPDRFLPSPHQSLPVLPAHFQSLSLHSQTLTVHSQSFSLHSHISQLSPQCPPSPAPSPPLYSQSLPLPSQSLPTPSKPSALPPSAPQLSPVSPPSLPVPPSVSISLVLSGSQPGPGRLLCSVMDFYPAPVQVRWFQDGQELPEHVVATDVVPNGDWTYQVLVLLEIPPRRGVTYSCQVEHVSLEHPLSRHWEMPPDTVRSKILVGVGGFVLGLVFLALGLGFYLREKSS
ncbi:class II histocompatibility antigen, B-L beta chain-like [Pseudopipra pipra]|uniref:class II histocompatibility antigen, B-L beta chain-like n=1 Tax=Pseudopipra pipra TaxID=415032 RepID=UPI003138B026